MDDFGYESSCVVNVNWNADNRKWNVNTWRRDDDRWNAGNRAFSPETNSNYPLVLAGGFFVSKSFFQPPTIRPISPAFSDMAIYRLLSKERSSHRICRKNFNKSVFLITRIIVGSFSSLF